MLTCITHVAETDTDKQTLTAAGVIGAAIATPAGIPQVAIEINELAATAPAQPAIRVAIEESLDEFDAGIMPLIVHEWKGYITPETPVLETWAPPELCTLRAGGKLRASLLLITGTDASVTLSAFFGVA
jgi:hypothetical protein